VFAVKPTAVKDIAVKSTGPSHIALSWVYSEPMPPGLNYRIRYHSLLRPAYSVG